MTNTTIETTVLTGANADKFISKHTAIGIALANGFLTADDKANKTKRELILTNASKFAGNVEAVKYILTGYADTFSKAGYNDNTVKQRKAEANAVYKAVALTQVTGDNLNALIAFVGDFNGMINLARTQLKAHAEQQAKQVGKETVPAVAKATIVRPLTDLQLVTVNDSLKKANEKQLNNVISLGLAELTRVHADKPALQELSQLNLIANIANNMMSNEHFDKATQNVAMDIFKLANVHANKLQATQNASNKAIAELSATPYDAKPAELKTA